MPTVTDLARQVRTCTSCALRRGCKQPVPGAGHPHAKVMVVGQAPGWEENRDGSCWIGQAGEFLTRCLVLHGWTEKNIYLTNLVKCWPGRAIGGDNEPPAYAIEACRSHLRAEVEAVRPSLIVAVGAVSTRGLGVSGGIRQNAGKVFQTDFGRVLPILHPAGLMRPGRQGDVPQFVTQLAAITTYLTPPLEVPEFVQWVK